MSRLLNLLMDFFGRAWYLLVAALFIFGLLGLLAQVLRSAAALLTGSRRGWAVALSSFAGLIFIVLFGFLGVPALAAAVNVAAASPACGPLASIGQSAAQVLAAMAALRMLIAFVRTSAGLAAGGPFEISAALVECGEAVIGMLLAVAAGPLAAHFLGIC